MLPPYKLARLSGLIVCFILLLLIGCQSQPRKNLLQRVEESTGKKLRTTQAELRLKTQHAAQPLSGIIEAHADMILAETVDPDVRKTRCCGKSTVSRPSSRPLFNLIRFCPF